MYCAWVLKVNCKLFSMCLYGKETKRVSGGRERAEREREREREAGLQRLRNPMMCYRQAAKPGKWVVCFSLSPKNWGADRVCASLSPRPNREC